MLPITDANFVVIDVETTGSDPVTDRITDIACILIKNNEIISTYSSLINPHKRIPDFIQKMTGITNEMVKKAPNAIEIIPNVRDLLMQNNTFFVAHNYGFDWRFIHETINRENLLSVDVEKICTLKLARKIIPKTVKKNVGDLSKYFNISIENRHRAFDDAFATSLIFIELIDILKNNYDIFYAEEIVDFQDRKSHRTAKLDSRILEKIKKKLVYVPENSGIIKFIDAKGKIIHVAKSNTNMKEYLENLLEPIEITSKKINSILKDFARIDCISTDYDVEAAIFFNREKKKLQKNNDLFSQNGYDRIMNFFSLIVFMENSKQEKTVDVFLIYKSKFYKILTVGIKSNLDLVFSHIDDIFFDNLSNKNKLEYDIDEVIIVNNWIKKVQNTTKILHFDNQTNLDFKIKAEEIIRNFYKLPDDTGSGYKYFFSEFAQI